MDDFFPEPADKFISTDFLEKVRRKFHFGIEQTNRIRAAAEEMLPIIQEEAFSIRKAYSLDRKQLSKDAAISYECVAMSLGKGVDILQDDYTKKGMLLESYIVEALAGELLMQGYDAYNHYIAEHTTLHVARYHFPGSEASFPLEMLPALLQNLTQNITCNAAFCMQPKKSVVFISELTQDKSVQCKAICIGCTNKSCPNRIEENSLIRKRMTDLPLTYGYSRIFGIVS